jgi:hypothetical protein
VRLGEILRLKETLNRSKWEAGAGIDRSRAADRRANAQRACQIALFSGFRRRPSESLTNQAIRCFHRSREPYSNLNNRLSQALPLSKEEVS